MKGSLTQEHGTPLTWHSCAQLIPGHQPVEHLVLHSGLVGVDHNDVPVKDPTQDVQEDGVHELVRVTHPLDVVLQSPCLGEPAGIGAITSDELLQILNSIQSVKFSKVKQLGEMV